MVVPITIQTKPVSKLNHVSDIGIVQQVPKTFIELVCVVLVNLVIPICYCQTTFT
jgi:hypothetical protein